MNIVRYYEAQKRKTAIFRVKSHLKEVCYKVSLCKNCQRQSCRTFTGLSIHAKMIGGGRPLLRENLANVDPPPCTTPTFNLFSLIAPQP